MKPEQITAWALDEASTEERQQLEATLLENPQQKQTAEETKAFCDFLLSELRDDSLALTDSQRERLVGQSSRVTAASETLALPPAPRPPQTKWNIGIIVRLAVAACVALGGFWTWQAYTLNQRASHVVVAAEAPSIKMSLPQAPDAKMKQETSAQTRLLASAPVKAVIVEQKPTGKPLPVAPMPAPVAAPVAMALSKAQRVMTPGDVEKLKQIQDQNAYALNFGDSTKMPALAPIGVQAQKSETVAGTGALVPSEGSGVLVGSGGILPHGAGMLTLNGGGALTVGGAVSHSSGGRLTVLSSTSAQLKQAQERPASSLNLKGGIFPEQMALADLSSDMMAIDGFIDLSAKTTMGAFNGRTPMPPARVSPQKTGIVYCLTQPSLGMVYGVMADGWPLMSTVRPSLILTSGELIKENALVGYQPDVFIGDGSGWASSHFMGFTLGRAGPSLALVLNAARGGTGNVMVHAGASSTMNSFLRPHCVPGFFAGCISFVGNDPLMYQPLTLSANLILELPKPDANANSTGLLSFATAPASHFIDHPHADILGGWAIEGYGLSPEVTEFDGFVNIAGSSGGMVHGSWQANVAGANAFAGANLPVDLGNRYTGSTTITGGTLALTTDAPAPSAMAAAAGPLVLDSTSVVAGANSLIMGQAVSGTPLPPSMINAGTLDLNGASTSIAGGNTFSGGLSINSGAGTIQSESVSSAPGAVVLAGSISNASSTPATPREQFTFGANTSGSGAIVKAGSGALVLTGANTYSGGTTISGGVLSAAPAPLLSSGGILINSATGQSAAIYDYEKGRYLGAAELKAEMATSETPLLQQTLRSDRGIAGTLSVSNGAAVSNGVLMGNSTQSAPTQMNRSAGGTVAFGGSTLATATPAAVPAQGNSGAGATFTLSGTTSVTAVPAAAPALTFNSTANTLAVQGSGTVRTFMGANAAIPTDASPAPAQGPLVSNPQPDTRYFSSVDSISSIATKDMALKQEAAAYRKSDPSGESYTHIIENELKDVAREPLSTLSIDVDTASYANVRRFLNQGMIPPPDAVRIEELVNYFPTSEEGPAHEAKEPFGVRIELAPCPWQPVHRLARIAIKGRERDKDRKPSNLVFLVDVSGSMNEPAKLPLVQQSLRMLTEQLGEGDRVTMVVYAGSSGVVLPPTNGEKKGEILAAIDRLSAGGSTHGSAGIKLAYEQAVAGFIKGGVNRVILCTDGDFNVGVSSPEELEKLIKHKAKTGVFLSVLGFGSGNLQDRTMETLADKGNGNYAYIDSLSEARKVLVEQMGGTLDTIAKDVKIQVEFNPAAVRSYRLIGYENRLLAKEDFNDDTKDAGEIGAGHSVVALYEIVPANLPPGTEPRPAVDSLKYQAPAISPAQLAEAAKSGEMMTVKLRYKAPDSDLSKLIEVPTKDAGKTLTASSDEFKFSAAVASFGLLLRDSSYKGNLSWETVRRLALDGKGADTLGYRGEFLQLIDKARGLKETR